MWPMELSHLIYFPAEDGAMSIFNSRFFFVFGSGAYYIQPTIVTIGLAHIRHSSPFSFSCT